MTKAVDVCGIDEVPNGKNRAFDVQGRSVLLFRVNADWYAIENRCSHLDYPLAGGRQIGCEIICRQHGGRFDIRNGKAVGSPAVDPVRSFPVEVCNGRVSLLL